MFEGRRGDQPNGLGRTGGGRGSVPLRCEESYEILKIPETVLKIRLVGKRGSVENQRFSRNRLKPIIRPEAE